LQALTLLLTLQTDYPACPSDQHLINKLAVKLQDHGSEHLFDVIVYNSSHALLQAFAIKSFDVGLLGPLDALCATTKGSTVLANSLYTSRKLCCLHAL
jgi:hypothetical protein